MATHRIRRIMVPQRWLLDLMSFHNQQPGEWAIKFTSPAVPDGGPSCSMCGTMTKIRVRYDGVWDCVGKCGKPPLPRRRVTNYTRYHGQEAQLVADVGIAANELVYLGADGRSVSASGFRGVQMCRVTKKWRATIKRNKVSYHLGAFATKEEAGLAYREAALRMSDGFAKF